MDRREDLRELLERLQPQDRLEQAHKARMLDLVCDAVDPFDRAHYAPGHITASAFVVDRARAEVLLILHGKLGRWLQPGGHVDPSDSSVWVAAQREVREETGLETELVERLGEVRYQYVRGGNRVAKQVEFFLFRYRSGNVEDHDHEVEEALWIPLDEAPERLAYRGEREMAVAALSRAEQRR
jgi:8-oxo-dGTP pyrophosphatase MutT (NUDIX family)